MLETCFAGIRDMLPAVDALLSRYASTRLDDYVAQLGQRRVSGFQGSHDFVAEVVNSTERLLGAEVGRAIGDDLREAPQVLTANHHGIDTFAQSTQSNLLFSMRKRVDGTPTRTIPVLACGSVPLNNLTYPRGLLIYAGGEAYGNGGVCKLPLFPDSYKRKLVSVVGPISEKMLCRARARAKRLVDEGKLFHPLEAALNTVFDEFASVGQGFSAYSGQATVVNHRLWRRLFRDGFCPSELVYIELEQIAGRLLEKDLFDRSTICHQLMFDPRLRGRLIEKLDGQRGCWQHEKLLRRCSASAAADAVASTDSATGTEFFWAVDAKGRRVPLCITEGRAGRGPELCGIDDSGQQWTLPFTPEHTVRGIKDGRLLPSIFTSYLLLSIARGVSCIGGYYQADYLPAMQTAVIDTLRGSSGEKADSRGHESSGSDLYLSGMQAVGFRTDGRLLPAGPVEIIASGGLDAEQYWRIGEVTVLQSHIASLLDIITDAAPRRGDDFLPPPVEISKLVHDAVASQVLTIPIGAKSESR